MWVRWLTQITTESPPARPPPTRARQQQQQKYGKQMLLPIAVIVLMFACCVRTTNGFRTSFGAPAASGEGRKLFGGYRITPKHCRATRTLPMSDPRSSGPTICMFNHECAQRNGEVVGACMDGFLFGACCQLPYAQAELETTLIKDAQNSYYQQHQKQQAQLAQQAISSPSAAAPSYESAYGESNSQQQASQESTKYQPIQQDMSTDSETSAGYPTTQHDIFEQENLDKVYQQLEAETVSSSNYGSSSSGSSVSTASYGHPVSADENSNNYASSTTVQHQYQEQQQTVQQDTQPQGITNFAQQSAQEEDDDAPNTSSSSSTESAQSSSSVELEQDAKLTANTPAASTNLLHSKRPPPEIHVHKNSVKISSPSSPPHNDDFVMQVLSTIPPDQEIGDRITFTTEVPMKIASSIIDQTSSESNSFEEDPVTQPAIRKPESQLKKDSPQKTQKPQKTNVTHKQPSKITVAQSSTHQQTTDNTHNHNHLILSDTEFTHSDITHPGADTELLEDDLQFSTGYGPQPVYVESPPPKKSDNNGGYDNPPAAIPASDEKYVLVQTISNEQSPANKKTSTQSVSNAPTTSSSITTHVDSIESIILQLNGTNHGPAYNVINNGQQQSSQKPSYGADSSSASSEANQEPQSNYASPIISTPTSPPKYYEEIETKRPEDVAYLQEQLQSNQQNYGGIQTVSQIPAYLEPVTTNVNLNVDSVPYDVVSDEKDVAPMQNAYPTPTPAIIAASPSPTYSDDTAQVLDEHTMPESTYDDVISSSSHQTSEFNKMPAVGIAYPVDMAYVDEEDSGYGSSSTPQIDNNGYQKEPEPSEPQPVPSYTRRPSTSTTGSVASYIGVVNSQNYNQQDQQLKQPQASVYNQVPEEVAITSSSYTTKVQEDAYDAASPSTSNYGESPATVPAPTTARPSTAYISSTSTPLASRPQYNDYSSSSISTSTSRPVLITKAKPKPSKNGGKRPTKRPNGNTTKKPKPKPTQPSSDGYSQEPLAAASDYKTQTVKQPVNNYNNVPASSSTKPVKVKRPPATPSSTYQTQQDYAQKQPTTPYHTSTKKTPTLTNTYGQEVNQPSNAYIKLPNDPPVKTKKPAYQLEYTSARPTVARPHPSAGYGQNAKRPAPQPSISYNQDQHISSSPPAKRTTTRRPAQKKQPSGKPISTSYVTGPTTPRPPTTFVYHDNEVPPLIVANDKLDTHVQSTAVTPSIATYQAPVYVSSVAPLNIEQPQPQNNYNKKPTFVKIQSTVRPPMPTILITPKPTIINLVTSSSWTQLPSGGKTPSSTSGYGPTTPIPALSSTSYIYNAAATGRPDTSASVAGSTPTYVSMAPVTSNDFDDPGYFGNSALNAMQSTAATYAVPSDDRPAFPGYYGPTPTYPAFQVPGEKIGAVIEEETYTSPNDFVNFPPVRNPNLNMSAASSAVTTDLELSTPAFVEDGVLKDKMNTLVHKIVESLQDNFDALAEMIDESNVTVPSSTTTYQTNSAAGSSTITRRPTRKPASSTRPRPTTKRPATRVTTRRPATTTRRPTTQRRPATTTTPTRKATTRRPATRRPVQTTTVASVEDDLIDEEDGDDINTSENEIDQGETLSTANGRKLQCGVRPHVKSGRIVGGKGSSFGAFPWQVLVRESTWLGLFTKNKCGGVLITNRYVITAAHCQPGFLASLVAVMGEYDISGELESKRAVTKNVKRVIVHRQYDPATFENDLALLELESPVPFDTHIVPICMPGDTADFTGRMATVTGWGRLKYGGGVPSVLQEVQVPIIENSVCQEMFHTAGHNKKILGSFLCAGYANGQKDSCEGDSGGPLVLQRPDGRYELAGTVSHGIKCAAPYLPGVYMRTTFYKPWLRSITGVK